MSLDVVRLYGGIESHFGLDVVSMSDQTGTASALLLALDGSPITVGWFNDSVRKGLPHPGRDTYGLTTIPSNAVRLDHRQVLSQESNRDGAVYKEEDADLYLEGIDDYPDTFALRSLVQPALGDLIRQQVLGAKAMDRHTADIYTRLSRALELRDLRKYGRGLWAMIDDKYTISTAFLDECARG